MVLSDINDKGHDKNLRLCFCVRKWKRIKKGACRKMKAPFLDTKLSYVAAFRLKIIFITWQPIASFVSRHIEMLTNFQGYPSLATDR